MRADGALRAVALAPGRHRVEVRYGTGVVTLGILLSLAGLALGLGIALARPRLDSARRQPSIGQP
jgi:hypothetical protein